MSAGDLHRRWVHGAVVLHAVTQRPGGELQLVLHGEPVGAFDGSKTGGFEAVRAVLLVDTGELAVAGVNIYGLHEVVVRFTHRGDDVGEHRGGWLLWSHGGGRGWLGGGRDRRLGGGDRYDSCRDDHRGRGDHNGVGTGFDFGGRRSAARAERESGEGREAESGSECSFHASKDTVRYVRCTPSGSA